MNEDEPEGGGSYSATLGEYANNPEQPRLVGVPLVLPDKDGQGVVTYTLATDEARIKAQFEQQIKIWAQEPIADALRRGDPEEAAALRAEFMQDCGAGAYTWDGIACRKAGKDWRGLTFKLFLMLRRSHPKITYEECDELITDFPRDCGAAIRLAEGNFPSSHATRLRKEKRARGKATMSNGTTKTTEQEPMTMES
jgi:hypothetical protein